MAINIKDGETDRLARELAQLTGQPITTAVRDAIAAQLENIRRRRPVGSSLDLDEIIARGRARASLDDRSEDDILGYGSDGVPG